MDSDLMERTSAAIDRLNAAYQVDRLATIGAAMATLGLLLYLAYNIFTAPEPRWDLLVPFFGANGLLTGAMVYLSRFYSEAFKLLAEIVRAEISSRPQK